MEYGTANYDSGGPGGGRDLRIKSGKDPHDQSAYVTIFRICPPILGGKESGTYVTYEPKHWGYCGVNRDDPTKPRNRTFICVRERDWMNGGEIVQECDECVLIEELMEERESICPTKGLSKDVRLSSRAKLTAAQQERIRVLDEFLGGVSGDARGTHKLDGKPWKINAYSETEQAAGRLFLSSWNWYQIKARKRDEKDPQKQGLIDYYRAMGWDAMAPHQGLWFKLTRIGNGGGVGSARDKIEVVKVPVEAGNPMKGEIPKAAPIEPNSEIDRALGGCRDLSDCSPSFRLRPDQVAELVRLYRAGKNSPEAVDEVFGITGRPAPRAPLAPEMRQDWQRPESDDVAERELFQGAAAQPAPAPPAAAASPASAAPPAPAMTAPVSAAPAAATPPPPAPVASRRYTPEEEELIARFRQARG